MVVQREVPMWREPTALANCSDNNRVHYWADVYLQNASCGPPGVTVKQSFVALQLAKSPKTASLLCFPDSFSSP